MPDRFELRGEITKIDEDQRLVSGWFSVIEEDGVAVVDLEGDVIDEATLVAAMHDFNKSSRAGKAMHRGGKTADVVELLVFTREVQKALGIDLKKVGAFGTMKVHDDETWAAVKSGKYRAFSIGGRGLRRALP